MSASPADMTPGRTPNGIQAPKLRRPQNADPLVRPKKRTQRPPAKNSIANKLPNGTKMPGPAPTQAMPQYQGRPPRPSTQPSLGSLDSSKNGTSGFSSPLVSQTFHDYPLVLTKRAIVEGFRHHIARFSSKRKVDPRNSEEFVRPVRLHRRDPRAPPGGAGGVKSEEIPAVGADDMDDKERERQEILKAEREAKRELEMAQVAPSAASGTTRAHGKNMKKTEQIYRNDQTDEQKKQSQLRYEEALPWHLEDFDNKSVWVGSYEAALSDNYAMMIPGPDGIFRLVPLEKWYKFTQKNQFKALTAEEAELRFNKKIKDPRWFMESEETKQQRKEEQDNRKLASGLFLGKWEKGGGGSGQAAPIVKHENADADDLDFQEDRFADDEDNMNLFEEDQETKETEERIKKDQLQANVFDTKEEKEYEKQEKLEKKDKEMTKKFGKRTKKALMKREKNYIYDSDSSGNPYSSESESDNTETELLKEEERKKAEESKATPEKERSSKLKATSGSPSKGTSTSSHRPSKNGDLLKPSSSSTNLKRSGSPLNSEASGNESSRKKPKKKHSPTSSSQPQVQTNNTLKPPSRSNSPTLPPSSSAPQPNLTRKTSNVPAKRPRGGGSGSDTDGGAGSGGDMSDGARKRQKLKLNAPSKNGTPQGSRSGSPEVLNTKAAQAGAGRGSRAESPASATSPKGKLPPPTEAELRALIPPEGIKVSLLLSIFKGRVSEGPTNDEFMKMMRVNTILDTNTKIVKMRTETKSEASKPGTSKSETSKSGTSKSEASKPGTSNSEASKAEAKKKEK